MYGAIASGGHPLVHKDKPHIVTLLFIPFFTKNVLNLYSNWIISLLKKGMKEGKKHASQISCKNVGK